MLSCFRGILVSFAVLLTTPACSPTEPGPLSPCPVEKVSKGSMTALIDGVAWTAGCVTDTSQGRAVAFSMSMSGTDNANNPNYQRISIHIRLSTAIVPGTYKIGPPLPNVSSESYALLTFGCESVGPVACPVWESGQGFDSGTITITSFSETRASGTFSLTLFPLRPTPAIGTKIVTGGEFNVAF